jgi:hypothetical protein
MLLQGCQIFLGTTYRNGKIIPNDHIIHQITVKYTKWHMYTHIFHCKTLQNLPKLGFWVWKNTIWQPCSDGRSCNPIKSALSQTSFCHTYICCNIRRHRFGVMKNNFLSKFWTLSHDFWIYNYNDSVVCSMLGHFS